MLWKRSAHDVLIAAVGAGIALTATTLYGAAAPTSLDTPPEMRAGMDVAPILTRDAQVPKGQVRQVVGPWVLIKQDDGEFWWVNFSEVLLYQTDRR